MAPADFDPKAQTLNIISTFNSYSNANKICIFSVPTTATTSSLSSISNGSYVYSENGSAYTSISSGTVTWTAGSIKRHVITLCATPAQSSFSVLTDTNAEWLYIMPGGPIVVNASGNTKLKYIHIGLSTRYMSTGTGYRSDSYSGCTGLTGVLTIPESIDIIPNNAFKGCTGLTKINIPNSVTKILNNTFDGCTGLTGNLVLPNNLIEIRTYAFRGCRGLTGTLLFPISMGSIQGSSFQNCSAFSTLILHSGISSICGAAFMGCTFSTVNVYRIAAPSVSSNGLALNGSARPLHIPIANSGYNVAPWTTETIFSSIVADL